MTFFLILIIQVISINWLYMKFLGENSRYAVESLWTEISRSAAKGATQLQLFLQGQPQYWVLTETLKDNLYHWQRIYQTVTLVIDKQSSNS